MVNGKRLQRHIIKIQTPFNNENGYIVVLASPWYYRHISGFLKNAFDPLFAVAECDNYKNPVKDSILIMMAKVLDLKKAKSGMTIWKNTLAGKALEKYYAAINTTRRYRRQA